MASQAFLQQAYLAYFGRPADVSGLAYYASRTESEVKAAFSTSDESQAFFGSMTLADQINVIYNNLFNRDADLGGLQYWVNVVGSGKMSLSDAAMGILAGAKNDDLTTVTNKLLASEAFTAALNTSEEALGYSGTAAIAPARAFLAAVDKTTASLTAAVDGIDAAVNAVINADDGVAYQTFTLTADQETFIGNAKDNVFNSSPSNGILDTYVGDTLNGGDGTDTLNIISVSGGFFSASNIENINIRTLAIGTGTPIEMSNVTGVDTLTVTASSPVLLLDVQETFDGENQEVVYKNNASGTASELTIAFDPYLVDGTSDELNLTLHNNINGGDVTLIGIETVHITSVGNNLVGLSGEDATVNISGAGDLDLTAHDADVVNNTATSTVTLAAAVASEVNNEGADLTVDAVGGTASVTNSGAGALEYNDKAATNVALVNSGAGVLTVNFTGATASITNSGAEGTTNVLGSEANLFAVSAGTLDIADDAFATGATVNATGGALIMEATAFGATINAGAGGATVDLTINDSTGGTARTDTITLTGGTGDVTVKIDAAGALIATDVLTAGSGTNDVVEFAAGGTTAISFADFDGVTAFETLLYTGTAAVIWEDLDALEDTIVLEFGAVGATAADGTGGTAATATGDTAGTDGNPGGPGFAGAVGETILDLTVASSTAAVLNLRLTEDLSAEGGAGGPGAPASAGNAGSAGTTAATAGDGGDGGDGGAGGQGATGGSIIVTDAVTLTLELNGVTLDSSGGAGGSGGAGAAGGAGGLGSVSGTGTDGGAGGNGGNGGAGGIGGDAADTISATAATSVTIYSNVSEGSDTNELVADGGAAGARGTYGQGGIGGAVSAAGAQAGAAGINGSFGAAGTAGADASGLVVGEGATITVTGEGHLVLGEISQAAGATVGLTINANDDDLGAMEGDLTFEIAGDLNDTIIGGEGAHDITLNGGADTIDLSASEDVADSITLNSATGTDVASSGEVDITGFDLGLDTVTVDGATSVANSSVLVSTVGTYTYMVTDGVATISKPVNDPLIGASVLDDVVSVIFDDIFTAGATAGEAVVWTDGDDSWLFVSDGTAGYNAGDDYVVKLVGVEVTDIADVLA
jgi:hypothetical protein